MITLAKLLHDGWLLLFAMILLLVLSLRLSHVLPQDIVQAFGRIF